jgi:hypothetical protein
MKLDTIPLRRAMLIIPLVMVLVLSACNVVVNLPNQSPTATQSMPAVPTANPPAAEVLPTQVAAPTPTPAVNAGQSTPLLAVNLNAIAQDVTWQEVPAVPPSTEAPWWQAMPEYLRITLQGYPITDHVKQPQIYVFPVKDLGVNEAAGRVVASLQTLLQDHQLGQSMPYLPLTSDNQMMHAQVQYLNFANGQGVRFLTQLANGIVPINNHELFYTYQGLTNDNLYYLAVVLPVYLSGLPTYPDATDNLPLEYSSDYPTYISNTVNQLNLSSAGDYQPDLSMLDAMIQSIEIK